MLENSKEIKNEKMEETSMNAKVTGIVAYIGWIGWIIAFLAGDKEGAKFHLNQALVLNIASLISGVLSFIPVVGWVISIAILVFWIMGIVAAIKEEEKELPIIGKIRILK